MTKPNRETDGPRYTIATIQEEESTRKLIVASVYGPTASNKLTFFKDFLDKIEDHRSAEPTSDIIIAGDLNLHLDRLTQPTLAKNELLASMKRLKMIDTFRSLNKGKNGYTYWGRQGNTPSRIDYILVSETLIKHRAISETVSGASFQSDHDAVITQMDRPTRRGKKKANPRPFNDRMLSIKNFRSELEERLQMRLKGSQTGDRKDDDTLKTIQQNQPAHVQTLEEVYNIIEEVIRPLEKSFTRNYKNRLRRRRRKLQGKYRKEADAEQCEHRNKNLECIRIQLMAIERKISRATMNNIRTKMIMDGDKPTPFFLSKLKDPGGPKRIKEIQTREDDENSTVTNETEIEQHIATYFENIFEKEEKSIGPEDFLNKYKVTLNKIQEKSKCQLEEPPEKHEIMAAIKDLNNNASPGYDGVTTKLVKHLAEIIPDIITEAIIKEMEGEQGKTLLTRLRKMILIEKRDSKKKTVKKLRPISLLSVFYKIISTLLSTRIKGAVLENGIMPPNQNAYLANRGTALSIAITNDILAKAKIDQKDIFLVNTDLSAAFDTVSRELIFKILEKMNFPTRFIDWIKTLITGNWISLQINGSEARRLNHLRGLGQGDPLSALLFIISIIPIIEAIRTSDQIRGYNLNIKQTNTEHEENNESTVVKGTYFSDDGINIASNTSEVKAILQVYQDYSDCSGLETNLAKTKVIHNHNIDEENLRRLTDIGINGQNISENYEFLGYEQCANRHKPNFLSTEPLIQKITNKMKKSMMKWDLSKHSIYGRETIVNTMVGSVFNYYLMAALPTPSKELNELQKITDKAFMAKALYTKGRQRYLPTKWGGLGIPHIESKTITYTTYWIKQLINDTKIMKHLKPPALLVPRQMMSNWSINIYDVLGASPNDLKILIHWLKDRTGSKLWMSVLQNIIEIRKVFDPRSDIDQNSPTLWALQNQKKKNSQLTTMKKKALKSQAELLQYIRKNNIPSIFCSRWRRLNKEYPTLGDLIKGNTSTPISEEEIARALGQTATTEQGSEEWVKRTRETIKEKIEENRVIKLLDMKKMELMEELFIGDFGAMKKTSPGSKIYKTRIYDMA